MALEHHISSRRISRGLIEGTGKYNSGSASRRPSEAGYAAIVAQLLRLLGSLV